jgi:hypothetical protein
MTSVSTSFTPDVQHILTAHHQLWDAHDIITYKDQSESSFAPSSGGYRSVILNNSKGVPHLWITQNLHQSTYGTYAIQRAELNGEVLRITWIVDTSNNGYAYVGRIETHEYFRENQLDRIHIETYSGDDVNVIYTTNSHYPLLQSSF